jgi:Polysaccharide pyruvyl transferase
VKTLVAGWFSFEGTGATAGDLLAKDLVCEWLGSAGHRYEVALAPPFSGGVDWASADPDDYSHLVFVCGPFFKSNLLQRFDSCRLVGVNLSMTEPVDDWNPFDLLVERDSSSQHNPDITFLASEPHVPLAGLVLLTPPEQSKEHDVYRRANEAIRRFAARQDIARVTIDTELDVPNVSGLRTPAEIESLISRMDVVLTTRLHGMVLAIKNGVPAIAVDPIPGGGKIRRQADAIDWPLVLSGDDLTDEALQHAFQFCVTEEARVKAKHCGEAAVEKVSRLRAGFIAAMSRSPNAGDSWGDGRRRRVWLEHAPAPEPAATPLLGRLRQRARGLLETSRAWSRFGRTRE